MRKLSIAFLLAVSCAPLFAGDTTDSAQPASASARELSEGLIYSVDRVPERTFDTSRAVEVITISDLWRKSGMSLADVLQHEAGITYFNAEAAGGIPVVRGLIGKQIMVLIDGVKVNDTMWRGAGKDVLGLIDLSAVERVEIVRGVVSVLGTESLGGVVNIITKKGPPGTETFGGSIGSRYSTADGGFRTPLELYGQTSNLRWTAGGSYLKSDNMNGGGDVGEQPHTGYDSRTIHGAMQVLLSKEKTLSGNLQQVEEKDFWRAYQLAAGTNTRAVDSPSKFTLSSLSYQDLTDRRFEDSFRATTYFNRQYDARDDIRKATPTTENFTNETDNLFGVNLEFGTFLGQSHHILYGVDSTEETVHSKATDLNFTTEVGTPVRGRYTDGAKYRTVGLYLQDQFEIGRWLTTTAGVRWGQFRSNGKESSSVGTISIDARNSDFTGALNFVFHPTQTLNLIANVMRGFRAPNIDDLSRFNLRPVGLDVPNPKAGPENVNSYELGAKFENARAGGSLFYYRNNLSALLVRQPGTFRGLPFFDTNGNGKQDPKEPPIFQLQNVGSARITGYEGDFHVKLAENASLSANLTKTTGTDTFANAPLDRIAPLYGNLTLTVLGSSARRLWGEALFDFAGSQHRLSPADITDNRIGPNGTYGYRVLSVRGGTTIAERVRLMLGVDNLTDAAYKTHDSWVYRPGRQLVLATEYRF
jgi:hemoglobin/transferrin/lactoferrin receptor protein